MGPLLVRLVAESVSYGKNAQGWKPPGRVILFDAFVEYIGEHINLIPRRKKKGINGKPSTKEALRLVLGGLVVDQCLPFHPQTAKPQPDPAGGGGGENSPPAFPQRRHARSTENSRLPVPGRHVCSMACAAEGLGVDLHVVGALLRRKEANGCVFFEIPIFSCHHANKGGVHTTTMVYLRILV